MIVINIKLTFFKWFNNFFHKNFGRNFHFISGKFRSKNYFLQSEIFLAVSLHTFCFIAMKSIPQIIQIIIRKNENFCIEKRTTENGKIQISTSAMCR